MGPSRVSVGSPHGSPCSGFLPSSAPVILVDSRPVTCGELPPSWGESLEPVFSCRGDNSDPQLFNASKYGAEWGPGVCFGPETVPPSCVPGKAVHSVPGTICGDYLHNERYEAG